MLCMLSLDNNEINEFEVDKPSHALPRYGLWSSDLRPAGTRYIPHACILKSLKRAKPHPLY